MFHKKIALLSLLFLFSYSYLCTSDLGRHVQCFLRLQTLRPRPIGRLGAEARLILSRVDKLEHKGCHTFITNDGEITFITYEQKDMLENYINDITRYRKLDLGDDIKIPVYIFYKKLAFLERLINELEPIGDEQDSCYDLPVVQYLPEQGYPFEEDSLAGYGQNPGCIIS